MSELQYEFGMVGLGTMGWNLVYNMGDKGYSVAGYDKDTDQVAAFNQAVEQRNIKAFSNLEAFINSLSKPRIILMLVPAGPVVDIVINNLKPFLAKDDLVIDCGNSHFTDTDIRIKALSAEGIHFMGTGISGGETGAREGPSIMPGGPKDAYEKVAGMLKSIAAKVNNEPCVAYTGAGSSGHYVKMVHNGIEYAMMQLISEAYHLLKKIGVLRNEEIREVFVNYNQTAIRSYLIEITAAIFEQKDELSSNILLDMILDKAHQKGTGAWTSQDAMNLQIPMPSIDAAVSQRELTTLKEERVASTGILYVAHEKIAVEHSGLITLLQDALHFSMITVYAQGMALLQAASKKYAYNINLAEVASIWRGGCIIRSAMLEDVRAAYKNDPMLENLMVDKNFSEQLNGLQKHTRSVLHTAITAGIPVPAMMASLAYFDSYRSSWLPANLIQAQRDFFGAHTYERIDKPGNFHTNWKIKIN